METWWQAATLDLSAEPSVPGPTVGHIPPGDPCGAQHFRPPLWGGQLRSMSAPSRDEGSGKPNYPIGRLPGTCPKGT